MLSNATVKICTTSFADDAKVLNIAIDGGNRFVFDVVMLRNRDAAVSTCTKPACATSAYVEKSGTEHESGSKPVTLEHNMFANACQQRMQHLPSQIDSAYECRPSRKRVGSNC